LNRGEQYFGTREAAHTSLVLNTQYQAKQRELHHQNRSHLESETNQLLSSMCIMCICMWLSAADVSTDNLGLLQRLHAERIEQHKDQQLQYLF
jgi:hypothetical protein